MYVSMVLVKYIYMNYRCIKFRCKNRIDQPLHWILSKFSLGIVASKVCHASHSFPPMCRMSSEFLKTM